MNTDNSTPEPLEPMKGTPPILAQEIKRHQGTAGENIFIGYENLLIVARALERQLIECRRVAGLLASCVQEDRPRSLQEAERQNKALAAYAELTAKQVSKE